MKKCAFLGWLKCGMKERFQLLLWMRSILVICCYVTNVPKSGNLKQHTVRITLLCVRNLGMPQQGGSGSISVTNLQSSCWSGCRDIKACVGEDLSSLKWLLAGFRTLPSGPLQKLLICPYHIAAGFPECKWFKRETQQESTSLKITTRWKPQFFYNLSLDVTSHYFHHIPFSGSQ